MRWVFLLCLLIGAGHGAQATNRDLGIGFVLGSPTALSAKWQESKRVAFDVQLAFFSDDAIVIYGDYLYQFPGAIQSTERFLRQLTPYVGVGPVLAFASKDNHDKGRYFDERDDDFAIGARVPVGIEWRGDDDIPVGVGFELAPGIVILPHTSGFFMGGLTVRYYF